MENNEKKDEDSNFTDLSKKLFLDTPPKKRLIITPYPFGMKQIQSRLIDLRLDTEFILTKKSWISELDNKSKDILEFEFKNFQRFISVKFNDKLVLHPGQFILGNTIEYIKIPKNFIGYIGIKSSWGRLGLNIITPSLICPPFADVITLELTNIGEIPINLRPGIKIIQISFHKCQTFKMDNNHESKRFDRTCSYF